MRLTTILTATAILAATSGLAAADCVDRNKPGATGSAATEQGRIAKDGSVAPLQGGTSGSTGAGIAKDGSTSPLSDRPGSADANRAMSGQDVESQQHGGKTAQGQATDC